MRAILLDIEGTTTPLSFVQEVLFPFARAGLRPFLRRHGDEVEIRGLLADLRREYERDVEGGLHPPAWAPEAGDPSHEGAAAYLEWLSDQDRKATPLKTLQGLIWESGFRDGRLRGRVFEDVPRALERWSQAGLMVAIFSSGSVLAQRLFFQHTAHGALTPYLAAYFDTTTGPKREAQSYRTIASALDLAPSGIVFASDVLAELDAARAAGYRTVLVRRPGNAPVPAHDHPSCDTFDTIP